MEPISTEELLEGLSGMKLQREKRKVEVGTGPRGIPGSGFNHDNGYGSRAGGIGRPANQGYCNRAVQSSGGNDDPWGSGGGNDDDWVRHYSLCRFTAPSKPLMIRVSEALVEVSEGDKLEATNATIVASSVIYPRIVFRKGSLEVEVVVEHVTNVGRKVIL